MRGLRPRSRADWLTLAFSLAIVGGLVIFALVEEMRLEHKDGPLLEMAFDLQASKRAGDQYLLPFAVTNSGSEAILSAEILVEVLEEEEVVESAVISVSYLPLQGRQDGFYASDYDPGSHAIQWRLQSLQLP
jgi:uncharacterized protein (TIGR02588 family)